MRNAKSTILKLLPLLFLFSFNSCIKKDNTGLIGVYYNKTDLTYPKGVISLDNLFQKWDQNVDYKAGSGAVWNGYIESPLTGEITFQLSSTKKAMVKIADIEMTAANNMVSAKKDMNKGKKYPIEVIFLNEKDGINSGAFDVKWRWKNNDFSLIGQEYLSFTKKETDELAWLSNLDKSNINPANYLKATNTMHSVVYYEKGGFGAWPANNGIWSWGDEILVSFSKASYKSKPYQHSYDETKPSKRAFARSLDGGETWNMEEETVVSHRDAKPLSELTEAINFTHPGFAFTSSGDKFNVSYDKGKTWGTAYVYPKYEIVDAEEHSARTDYVVLDENTCRIFMASEYIGEKGWALDRAYMLETSDGGKNLEFISWIAETDTFRSVMPATVKITDNHMITALRRRYDAPKGVNHSLQDNWIDVYETRDGGRTWQFLNKIADTDRGRRNGNPPAMVRLSDGTLCVAYGYRGVPYSIRARTSIDNGKTWSKEIIIRDDVTKWDMGYVRMVVRPDDKVVMVYYYTTKEMEEQHIEATIWNPKDVTEYKED